MISRLQADHDFCLRAVQPKRDPDSPAFGRQRALLPALLHTHADLWAGIERVPAGYRPVAGWASVRLNGISRNTGVTVLELTTRLRAPAAGGYVCGLALMSSELDVE